jgi:hypothetical protein
LYDRSLVGFDGLALSGGALARSIAAHDARASAQARIDEQSPEDDITIQERARADARAAKKEEKRAQIRELRRQLLTARHERAQLETTISDMSAKSGVQPRTATPVADLRSLPVAVAAPCAKVSEMSKQASCHRDMFAKELWRFHPKPLTQGIVRKDGLRTSASAPSFGAFATSAWTLEHSPQGSCIRLSSHMARSGRSGWKAAKA